MIKQTDVAVIGSGFSAVALSLNLVELLPPTASVSLIGPSEGLGKGVAYAATADCHLLNVPAGRMSLFPDQPDHFVEWLVEEGHGRCDTAFVPRSLYGRYVRHNLDAALKRTANRAALSLMDAEALRADASHDGGLLFTLSNGTRISAAFSALCTGAGTSRLPLPETQIADDVRPFVVHNPWQEDWTGRLPTDGDVLFVGTGLTMVDQCLLIKRHGFRGTIHAASRHGLMPQSHLAHRSEPLPAAVEPGQGELSAILGKLRTAASSATDWRAVVDGLRPVTQALWKGLTPLQRRRFMRHAASFWNVHRHRMAPEVAAEIALLRDTGRLTLHRGRLAALRHDVGRITASIDGRTATTASVDMVVNCTGFERCTISASPLLANLAEQGIVEPDPNGIGIAVDDDSAVLGAGHGTRNRLYALGALTAGRHWEITAVPDIRAQAKAVAEHISRQVHFT